MINCSDKNRSSSEDFNFSTDPNNKIDNEEIPPFKFTETEIIRSSEQTADFNESIKQVDGVLINTIDYKE